MNKFLNKYRIAHLIIFAVTFLGMHLNEYSYQGNMLYTNVGMAACMLLILLNSSVTSAKFILTFILYTVALVPGAAYYLFGMKLYSYVNFDHQLIDSCTAYTLFLFYVSFNVYTFIVLTSSTLQYKAGPLTHKSRIPFFLLCAGILVCTYLTESGSTLISASYMELMDERSSLMTLAGVALVAFWADAYGYFRGYMIAGHKKKQWIFIIVTLITIIWFVLHARRTELIGFLSILLIHQQMVKGKIPYLYIMGGFGFLIILYVIGYTRIGALTEIDVGGQVTKSFSSTFESHHTKTEFANMPSGLGNIAETMQTSVYHFHYKGHEFLNGSTMYSYPYKMIPTNLINLFELPPASQYLYHELVLKEYFYNGGTYVLAPYYGNFGLIGLLVGSILFGLMVNWTQNAFYSNNYLNIVFATIVILLFIKMTWYGFLPLAKALFYNFILLGIISLLFSAKGKSSSLAIQ